MEAIATESTTPGTAAPELDLIDAESRAGEDGADREKRREFREEALPHLDDLNAFALRLTGGDEADAEDLVQVTMLRAYRSWDTYELGTDCGAWLRTILRNCFVNRFRSAKRRRESVPYEKLEGVSRLDGGSDGAEWSDPFRRPDAELFDRMVDGQVVDAVESLREEFRVPLVLVDVEGMSYREVSEALGIPVGTVKSRLYRARRRLRGRLEEYARQMGYVR